MIAVIVVIEIALFVSLLLAPLSAVEFAAVAFLILTGGVLGALTWSRRT